MSIDFEAIKRKLERLSGTTRNRSVMWKPTEGEEHTVRLLSFPNNDARGECANQARGIWSSARVPDSC